MKNFDHLFFLTKTASRITRIVFKTNTLPQQIRLNYLPTPNILRYKYDTRSILLRRIESEVDRRKYGHVQKETRG